MIYRTVDYTDFDDHPQSEKVWFHISKDELMVNLDIKDQVEEVKDFLEGEKKELTIPEMQKILALIKRFFKIGYGIRVGDDGKRFRKKIDGEPVWEEFIETAAYEKFMDDLFENPADIFDFINEVMPKDLMEAAQAQAVASSANVEAAGTQIAQQGRILSDRPDPAAKPPSAPEPARHKTPEELEAENAELRARLTAG